jgi:hypothetical protein
MGWSLAKPKAPLKACCVSSIALEAQLIDTDRGCGGEAPPQGHCPCTPLYLLHRFYKLVLFSGNRAPRGSQKINCPHQDGDC